MLQVAVLLYLCDLLVFLQVRRWYFITQIFFSSNLEVIGEMPFIVISSTYKMILFWLVAVLRKIKFVYGILVALHFVC